MKDIYGQSMVFMLENLKSIENNILLLYNESTTIYGDIMSDLCKPIGFFDSGVGGISVLKTAYLKMPNENYIYYGDNLNAPYGERTEEEIKSLSLNAGRFLFEKGVKAIVMACNTATSAAVKTMRSEFNIPVISMEPAVKPALNELKDGKVVVLATPATVSQKRYLGLIKRLDAEDRVINIGCPGLADLIERGQTDKKTLDGYFSDRLSHLEIEKIDAVVIGCTHYSFIVNEISGYFQTALKTQCRIFDGRHGTVRQLQRILDEADMRCRTQEPGTIGFYSSGDESHVVMFKKLFESLPE